MKPSHASAPARIGPLALSAPITVIGAAVAALALAQTQAQTQAQTLPTLQTWDFEVRLDDKPIGSHRFVVSGGADAREVQSTARFDVKLLGFNVYRYRHEASERWRGDCLAEIHARTDDDGKTRGVNARADDADSPIAGCVMSYAYWHPALVRQTRLLNPQTGRVDDARFERLADATLRVGGRELPAIRWKLSTESAGTRQDLTLWIAREDGRWIGLDARVKGDRLLTYRLP